MARAGSDKSSQGVVGPRVAAIEVGKLVDPPSEAVAPAKAGKVHQRCGPPVPKLGFSIPEFCKSVGISQAFYFELKKAGLGPREMALGKRKVIFIEEAIRWCRSLTEAADKTDNSKAASVAFDAAQTCVSEGFK